jgi:hypothetical protein
MEEGTAQKISISEQAQNMLLANNLLVNADGSLTYKGVVATPVAINPNLDLNNLTQLVVDVIPGKDNTLSLMYHLSPIEYDFEAVIANNEQGEDTLYLYSPHSA